MKPLLFSVMCFLSASQLMTAQIADAKKLIVTITENWESNKGEVYRFDRSKNGWKIQQGSFSVSVGDSGLAWGDGLHPVQKGRKKIEGDKRSPAGIFELDSLVYGLRSTPPEGLRFPYRQMTAWTRCVDDTASLYYNRIIEQNSVQKDWERAEEMGRVDPDYQYVLAVRHNTKAVRGGGSCIFFHINNVPTSGCTSMHETDMLSLLYWLDPNRKTVVVQLPLAEYRRLQHAWHLPDILNR